MSKYDRVIDISLVDDDHDVTEDACGIHFHGRTLTQVPSFTCPRCGMTSYNPDDIREGYCGNCHDWTRDATSSS
jgi:ribosomal protein L37E